MPSSRSVHIALKLSLSTAIHAALPLFYVGVRVGESIKSGRAQCKSFERVAANSRESSGVRERFSRQNRMICMFLFITTAGRT